MLTIIESDSRAWALAATNGDLRIYSREQAGDWIEVPLSENAEEIDQDGSLILEALYEQRTGARGHGAAEDPEAEQEPDPEAEEEEFEGDEEEPAPEDDEELEGEDDEESGEEEEEEKPRSTRAKTRAGKK